MGGRKGHTHWPGQEREDCLMSRWMENSLELKRDVGKNDKSAEEGICS